MCIGVVAAQREGAVGAGYLYQCLASILAGQPTRVWVQRPL